VHPRRPFFRIADRNNELFLQVLSSSEGIDNLRAVKSHGVDGKIAAREILLKGLGPCDRFGMAAVLVVSFFPEGRYFIQHLVFIIDYAYGAVGIVVVRLRKKLLYFFRRCVCGEIPVVRGFGQEQIAHGASHGINAEPVFAEYVHEPDNAWGQSKHDVIILANPVLRQSSDSQGAPSSKVRP
jgi:hypothetical protein